MWQLYFKIAVLGGCHNKIVLPPPFRHNLLSLALLFLLLTVPDLGTLDPVLVSLQPLDGDRILSPSTWALMFEKQTYLTCPHGARRGSQDRRQNYTWSSCTLLGSQTRARAMCRGGSASGVPLRRKYEVSRQGCASKCLKAFERQNPK